MRIGGKYILTIKIHDINDSGKRDFLVMPFYFSFLPNITTTLTRGKKK